MDRVGVRVVSGSYRGCNWSRACLTHNAGPIQNINGLTRHVNLGTGSQTKTTSEALILAKLVLQLCRILIDQ